MQNIILQTNIDEKKAVAKVRCSICRVDMFEVIEKGKNKIFLCDECK